MLALVVSKGSRCTTAVVCAIVPLAHTHHRTAHFASHVLEAARSADRQRSACAVARDNSWTVAASVLPPAGPPSARTRASGCAFPASRAASSARTAPVWRAAVACCCSVVPVLRPATRGTLLRSPTPIPRAYACPVTPPAPPARAAGQAHARIAARARTLLMAPASASPLR